VKFNVTCCDPSIQTQLWSEIPLKSTVVGAYTTVCKLGDCTSNRLLDTRASIKNTVTKIVTASVAYNEVNVFTLLLSEMRSSPHNSSHVLQLLQTILPPSVVSICHPALKKFVCVDALLELKSKADNKSASPKQQLSSVMAILYSKWQSQMQGHENIIIDTVLHLLKFNTFETHYALLHVMCSIVNALPRVKTLTLLLVNTLKCISGDIANGPSGLELARQLCFCSHLIKHAPFKKLLMDGDSVIHNLNVALKNVFEKMTFSRQIVNLLLTCTLNLVQDTGNKKDEQPKNMEVIAKTLLVNIPENINLENIELAYRILNVLAVMAKSKRGVNAIIKSNAAKVITKMVQVIKECSINLSHFESHSVASTVGSITNVCLIILNHLLHKSEYDTVRKDIAPIVAQAFSTAKLDAAKALMLKFTSKLT